MSHRLRRSVLFVPGASARALDKARTLDADGLVLDLEDAVSPESKTAAREAVLAALAAGGYGKRELVVRVNGLATPWGRTDLRAVAMAGADAVLLPKVESATDILAASEVLRSAGAPDTLPLWAMLETPHGVLRSETIAASPRLEVLVMGTSDLTKDLHAEHTPGREPLLPSLGLCLLAARAHRKVILDGVHLDLGDDEGFAAACRQARAMGFDGKTLIHPQTIATANRVFSPAAEEVARARAVVEAFRAARARGSGVVVVEGRLVEALHVEHAERVLELAAAVERRREQA